MLEKLPEIRKMMVGYQSDYMRFMRLKCEYQERNMQDLEFSKAPREHLDTWEGVKKFGVMTSIAVIVILAFLAIFFV
jgi:hypothetical protein